MEEPSEDKENTAPKEVVQQEEPQEDEGEDWNVICQGIRDEDNPISCDNLKLFDENILRNESSLNEFGRTIEEFQSALDAIMERIFTQVTAPIYQAQRDRMDALEADIIQSMKQNHNRRTMLVQALENHNQKWQSSYSKLMGKILQVPVEQEAATQGELESNGQDNKDPSDKDPADSNDKESEDLDPDWEELAQYEPTQENIRRFLEERERFRAADEHFRATLDDIYANLKMTFEKMVNVSAEVHESVAETMDEKQVDIQQHMVSNLQRRQDLQKALEEKAKQAQGIFASLMARVTTSFSRSKKGTLGKGDKKRKASEQPVE